jgi:hypothetical protein
MKFPSIKTLLDSFSKVVKRFPFEILFVLTGTVAGIINIELENIDLHAENWCIRVMMMSNLGFLFSLAVTLYTESKAISDHKRLIMRIIATVLGGLTVLMINPMVHNSDSIRFVLLSLSAHLLVAFSAYTADGLIQGFWQFNKTLFLRFLTSVLYSTVLYAGIATAIGSINLLFNADFRSDTFFIVLILIAGLFNTCFFLAGVPADLRGLDQDQTYPKGLKIFTQYVLIPLATIYVVILLAYEIKIALQWNLPKGSVSSLILGYAVFGLLSILLVFPIKDEEENKWIKSYARSFYFLMLPLLILLFLAVGTRIFKYGITEFRYFLILLSCWLLFITIYFLASRRQNIKVIPISLCLLTLTSIYGPQSAFSVSMYSQRAILLDLLKDHKGIKDGKIIPLKRVSPKDARRIVATLEYLSDQYGMEVLQPYMDKNIAAVSDSISNLKGKDEYDGEYTSRYNQRIQRRKWLIDYVGLTNFAGYSYPPSPGDINHRFYSLGIQQNQVTSVKGYDFIIDDISLQNRNDNILVDQVKVNIRVSKERYFSLSLNGELVRFDLKTLLKPLLENPQNLKKYSTCQDCYEFPSAMLSFSRKTSSFLVSFRADDLRIEVDNNKNVTRITFINAKYLVSKR